MLDHRLRLCPNIELAQGQCIVFAGIDDVNCGPALNQLLFSVSYWLGR